MRRYKVIEAPDKGVQTVLDARERRICSGGRWRRGNGVEDMCPRVVRHSVSHFSECVYWDISCSYEDRDHALRLALEEQFTYGSGAAALKYQLSRRLHPEGRMYRHLRKLGRRRPSDYDGSGVGDEEDDTSASTARNLYEARDENDSSSTLSDSYRFALIGVEGPTDCVGVSEPDPAVLRSSIAQFMVELLQNLVESRREPTSNVVFSPLVVETTLALLYSMAAGPTAEQIANAMHIQCAKIDLQKHVLRHACSRPTVFRPYFTLNNRIQLRARPPEDTSVNDLPTLARAFDVDLKYA
ncbi:hypothetical protein HPB51_012663 [Rhipicephalus microplus]|uniref:Serpin domain-containing protein n=1 Tax=Rhipicephalus microplus TaxID=6941 RepID=A0A9J6E1P5_RHIMP|nr:hypothetical protein HPB51_012663 [Rhipicephalus microplus]